MQSWGILIAFISVVIAISTFYEKFYRRPETDDYIRYLAVRIFDQMERFLGRKDDLSIIYFALVFSLFPIAYAEIVFFRIYIAKMDYDAGSLTMPILIDAIFHTIFFGLAGIFAFMITVSMYFTVAATVIYLVFYHFLNKITDIKLSPLTFLVAVASLMLVFSKASLDIIKAAFG